MSAQIEITSATLPEGACYSTEQERLNAFAESITGQLPENYSTVNVGPDAPEANDRDKPWIRSNSDGSPDRTYIYFNGTWKSQHPLDPGHIHLWLGSTGDVDSLDGGAAGVVTVASGPFWEIVSAFAAKFPVGVGTFAAGDEVAVSGAGGLDKVTLETKNIPATFGRFGTDVVKAFGKTSGAAGASIGGSGPWQALDLADFIVGGTTDTDKSHENKPPFLGCYFIRRTSRRWYSI